MSHEVAPARKPRSAKAKPLSPEQARSTILAKLEKGGGKGALIPAQKDEAKQAIYAAALSALEADRTIFADRRKAKPRFYLWALRPSVPTAESVAAKIEQAATARFPLLLTEAELKKALAKEEKTLLEPALAHAVQARLVVELKHRSGKTEKAFYVSAARIAQCAGQATPAEPTPPAAAPSFPDSALRAYESLVHRTGFRAVSIAAWQAASGLGLEALKAWLLAEHRAGRVVLSEGDWSLATEAEREGAIELNGHRCILARLLS